MYFSLHSHNIQLSNITTYNTKFVYLLGNIQRSLKKPQKTFEIYTEKGAVTAIWLVFSSVEARKEFPRFQWQKFSLLERMMAASYNMAAYVTFQ